MNIRLRIVQKCAFENARSESLYHLKDAVRLWNSMGMDFSVSLGDLIDGQNMGSHRLGNAGSWAMRFNSRCRSESFLSPRGPAPAQKVTP